MVERIRIGGNHPADAARPSAAVESAPEPEHPSPARPVVFYEGRRICFRPVELEDEPLLRRWVNDPENWAMRRRHNGYNALQERAFIESLAGRPADCVLGIVAKEGHRLIGINGLHDIDPVSRKATYGIKVGEAAWRNRGYGAEAVGLMLRYGFEELNLNRIELQVCEHNWRAIRVYQRAGFVHEGCLREAVYVNGRYRDVYQFAILRREWEAAREEP